MPIATACRRRLWGGATTETNMPIATARTIPSLSKRKLLCGWRGGVPLNADEKSRAIDINGARMTWNRAIMKTAMAAIMATKNAIAAITTRRHMIATLAIAGLY